MKRDGRKDKHMTPNNHLAENSKGRRPTIVFKATKKNNADMPMKTTGIVYFMRNIVFMSERLGEYLKSVAQ